jgi:signal transduction histidine kinase
VENLLHLLSVRNRGRPDGRVDLVELARDVVADRAPMAIEKSVDVGVETNAESVVIEGDQRLLHVALCNLIDNAVSLSRPGDSVDVVVTADQEILVRDHGPGVPVDNRESIFEPFTKEPPNRRGHGLGLAIVRAIVNLHEGDIRVEETVGGGATFVMKV